jgi:uncharacterized protein (DUF983 family)
LAKTRSTAGGFLDEGRSLAAGKSPMDAYVSVGNERDCIMSVETWTNAEEAPQAARAVWPAIGRGLAGRCPHCGEGRLFSGFLRTVDKCESCGEDMHHHRADDLPPYLTIIIVGHLIVPIVLLVEQNYHPAVWLQLSVWLPLTLVMTLALLRPLKGAVVGMQWANRMHGFGDHRDDPDPTWRADIAQPRDS